MDFLQSKPVPFSSQQPYCPYLLFASLSTITIQYRNISSLFILLFLTPTPKFRYLISIMFNHPLICIIIIRDIIWCHNHYIVLQYIALPIRRNFRIDNFKYT